MEESKPFPEDPVKVLHTNDAHRRPDVGNADLWSADQLASLPSQAYQYQVPTLVPRVWPKPRRVTQAAYDADFRRRDPLAALILEKMNPADADPRVVAAGGAAAAPYYEMGVEAGDVDFFVVGLDPNEPEELWKLAHDFTETLRESGQNVDATGSMGGALGELIQILAPGVLTLALQIRERIRMYGDLHSGVRKYQLILRAYPSAGAVVHGFDIPSCCTFYDGRTAWSTTLGAYAHRFRVNLVNPAYRSTTYESRLIKYFKRHYALGFVHLATGVLRTGVRLPLPHLAVTPLLVRGNRVTGEAEVEAANSAESDYESIGVNSKAWWWDGDVITRFAARFMNLAQLASGNNRFVMIRCTEGSMSCRSCYDASGNDEWLPFQRWYGEVEGAEVVQRPPVLAEIFAREDFGDAVDAIIQSAHVRDNCVRTASLSKYLGMSTAEVAFYVQELLALMAQNPNRKVSASGALQPFKDRLAERYEAAEKTPIEWWVTADPERQYTASLNPRMENPAEWYGAELLAAEPGKILSDVFAQSLLAALESDDLLKDERESALARNDNCALCITPLVGGAPNSMTLTCGHVFHATFHADSGCRGLIHWMRKHSQCPCCRKDFGEDVSNYSYGEGRAPIPLNLNWTAFRDSPAPSNDHPRLSGDE